MKGKKKFWLIFSVAAVVLFVWIIRYKAINQDYRQRWSANTEKTYSVGEIVPIAPDFVGYNLAAEGYMLQVKHRLTRAHREKQLKMSCQALHNAPPNRT